MRIFVDARPINEPQPSGVSTYAFACIRALLDTYPQHTFILYVSGMARASSAVEDMRSYANAQIRHIRIPNKLLHMAFLFFRWPTFERLVGKCDCYFFPNAAFVPQMPHPSILTLHDMSFMHYRSLFPFSMRLWHRLVAPESMLKTADGIIAVSRATEITYKEMFQKKIAKEIVTIFSASNGSDSAERNATHVLCIGNIEERKNIAGVVLAWEIARRQMNSPYRLLLVGKRGYLTRGTKRLLARAIREGYVEECGYVDEKRKDALLSGAAALFFPSLYEGYGFPIVEAIARGIPIVTSAKASMPEVVGLHGLSVDPFDVTSIAKGMFEALTATTHSVDVPQRSWTHVAHETMLFLEKITRQYAHRN